LGSISRGNSTKVIKGGTFLNKMIQVILLNSHVIIVESKDISILNVLILTKRRRRLVIGKRRKRSRKDVPTQV